MSNAALPLSGLQYTISHGDYEASIASVGASLRQLTHAGRDLVVPFEADEIRPAFRGATLAPWPNRIVGGRYDFGGETHVLALTEPKLGHALHGLVGWQHFDLVAHSEAEVVLETVIQAQAGYPWQVVVTVTNTLTDAGLATAITARNNSTSPAPWGTGPHPYLVAGPGRLDDWTLELPASQVLLTTEALAPTELAPVESVEFDWRSPRPIGDIFIDHAFTDLAWEGDGRVRVRLTDETGHGVEMSWAGDCPWVQIHTADQVDPAVHRLGLAVEPMTCPPDAFNSGTDLVTLLPGGSSSAGWLLTAL